MRSIMIRNLLFLILFTSVSQTYAEKLSLSTHDSLIQKLESVLDNGMKDSMVKQSQLALRLADLYAERARLLSLENEGKGDVLNKTKIEEDRKKALKIYASIDNQLKSKQKGRVHLQAAHLNILTQNEQAAVQLYSRIIQNPKHYEQETLAIAHIQLGDIYFYKGEFKKSREHFTAALKLNDNPRKAYSFYRSAWCDYNLGQTQLAQKNLIQLLNNKPLLLTKNKQPDISFQEDVSRDLATFMAKNDIVENDIQILSDLSPESTRQKNLVYLASELDRTAKKPSAILVWKKLGQKSLSFEDQLEGQIRITRIQYDLGHKENLVSEINNSIKLLKQSPCPKNPECSIGQQNLKKILTDWGRAEERNPSKELILSYHLFSNSFDDFEMSYWTAQSAMKRKLYMEAFNGFRKSATLLSEMERSQDQRLNRMFEASLLGAIEASEKMNSKDQKLIAYKLYLDLNPKGEKFYAVKYQIAHWYYDINDYSNALQLFKELALQEKASFELRDKSAELCLDISVITKNEGQIESDSLLFANTFKTKTNYYLALWRKSILNQSAKIINNTTSQTSTLEGLWNKIDAIELNNWPLADKKKLIKNKLSLGIKLKNLEMIAKSTDQYLAIPNLPPQDKEASLVTKAWVYEMKMDFKSALVILRDLKPAKNKQAEHHYKLALLSELAKQDPTEDYLNFMAVTKDKDKKQQAAYQLILLSKNPRADFLKYTKLLKSNTQLYAAAGIYTYERTKDTNLANNLLKNTSVKNTFEGQILAHMLEFKNLAKLHGKIIDTKIVGVSDRKLQKNIITKMSLLKQLEKRTQSAVSKKDSSLQLITLAYLAHENTRLANDILSLPAPKQLNEEQKKQYLDQVRQQISPFQTKSLAIKEKAKELWNESTSKNLFKDIYDLAQETGKPGSELAKIEIANLKTASLMVGYSQDPFIKFTQERHKMVSEAQSLEQSINKDPFNFSDLEKYRELQKELGSGPLVAYLNSRLFSLNQMGGK